MQHDNGAMPLDRIANLMVWGKAAGGMVGKRMVGKHAADRFIIRTTPCADKADGCEFVDPQRCIFGFQIEKELSDGRREQMRLGWFSRTEASDAQLGKPFHMPVEGTHGHASCLRTCRRRLSKEDNRADEFIDSLFRERT